MNQRISVIVPVYNVQRYLPQCLDSLLSQTYEDLEIFLIDDGSTDTSGAICDRYAAKDPRITVIHQPNGGAANAKNTGLRQASGQYLAFLDSDDFLEPDAYRFMLEAMNRHGTDAVQCRFRDVFVDKNRNSGVLFPEEVLDAEAYLALYTTDWTCGLLWDKLYRRELFAGILFEEGHKIDDEFFTYQGMLCAKILRTPKVIYNYRQRRSGIMLSPSSCEKIVLDKLDYLPKRRAAVLASFPNLKALYDNHYANALLLLSREPGATRQSLELTKQLLRRFCRERPTPKISLHLKLLLLRFLHTNTEALLKKRADPLKTGDPTGLFD